MAQNITLMGASYSDVPAVTLPKTGGGTATFTDTSDANAAASDIASGKTAYVDGVKITGTGSGGGGASNIVTGTFTGTTTGAAMDVDIPYTGGGYPLAVLIYPAGGPYNSSTDFYNLIQRYAINIFLAVKDSTDTQSETDAIGMVLYKNSTSNSTTYARNGGIGLSVFTNKDATSSYGYPARIKSSTKMSVFIASTSYGFAANIPYQYCVIYSE